MTVYTVLADSEIDPESAGNTSIFTKLRDNPIAITEGATGAPRISGLAIDYSLSDGLSQNSFMDDGAPYTESGGGFAVKVTLKVKIPSNATSIEYYMYQSSSNTGNGGSRLSTSTNNGTTVVPTGSALTWDGPGTLLVSDKSGWTDITIQAAGSASPASIITYEQVTWTFI